MNNTQTNLDIVNEPSNYFVIFPTRLLEICSHRQCILMGMLISLSNRHGYCYAKNKTLSMLLDCSEISIKRDLRHLEANALISRHVIRKETGEVIERKIYVTLETPPPYQNDPHPQYQIDMEAQYQKDPSNSNNSIVVNNSNKTIDDTFENAWKEYTKKGVKKTALRSWKKLTTTQRTQAIEHIPSYIQNHRDHNKLPYLPHFATYLNQERWNDDLPYGSDQPRNIDWG